MTTYFLRTTRLGFREWTDADLPLALALWQDPDVTRLIGGAFTEEAVRARLAREQANLRERRMQYWPVFQLADGAHVGACGLKPYPDDPDVIETGFHLHRAHWGKGYATEASRAVIAYAFDVLGAARVFAGHHPDNAASQRVLDKLGFAYAYDEYFPPTDLVHRGYLLTPERFRAVAGG